MDHYFCKNFPSNSVLTYYSNKTINFDRIVSVMTMYDFPPFIYDNIQLVCGVFVKLIVELSQKFGYR